MGRMVEKNQGKMGWILMGVAQMRLGEKNKFLLKFLIQRSKVTGIPIFRIPALVPLDRLYTCPDGSCDLIISGDTQP